MFTFGFKVSEPSNEDSKEVVEEKSSQDSQTWFECSELALPDDLRSGTSIDPDHLHVFLASVDIQVEYINCLSLDKEELSQDVLVAEHDHSDLVPGQYEGGLKVWECTFDLGELMVEREQVTKLFKGATVLDLGCGSGILGILAAKLGAAKVVFQDYNKDVIEKVTMKNYSINCCGEESEEGTSSSSTVKPEAQFYCGDWGSFVEKDETHYDVILTAETIYSTNSYDKLIKLFKSKLKPDGVILLAAKTYYFGVGGGLRLFEKALQEDGHFSHQTVWECESGVKREILEIKTKPQSGE
ncbi:histidine protein methyltransferase 1 homolog [Culex quinquefasciatus]|uniref:histidine protein methyltransferase 1 homolog n=1 Tax=Culex quinquefasciatus TaxID=7176 RepID=UPI0018E38B40|nr:histidine protein methyltransferase 1 homolog [Culex quinquefasciatus]